MTHRNDNLEARELVSDAIIALSPCDNLGGTATDSFSVYTY